MACRALSRCSSLRFPVPEQTASFARARLSVHPIFRCQGSGVRAHQSSATERPLTIPPPGHFQRDRRIAEMDAGDGEAARQHSPGAPTSPAAPLGRSSPRLGATQSFDGALRELKDLRLQLHQAADCCEKAFLGTEKKKMILDSTKSYICDAVVTVIDHLGNVSSKLEHQLEDKTEITQTEQKINFLKQRLLTCEQYAISLNILTLPMDRNSEENAANSRGHPVPGDNRTLKPYDVESTIGREVTVAVPDVGNPASITRSFSFRAEDVHISPGDHKKKKKASHTSNILSFLKISKRHA
uniref:Uncharacterized protein n=1 Tax=Avena sativa TaxID=4498 RepID=A0ACD5VRJ4_AVESA